MSRGAHLNELPHKLWFFYLPRICNHCSYPACLAACPRGAIYKRNEDGIVLIDQKRCRGYRECVRACPYGKTMFRANHGVSEKCIGCFPKVEQGMNTQCVEQCIGKIRGQGWISAGDEVRKDHPIDYLVRVRKIALPLYPQFGTGPNVYYIPPIHVPADFLEQMFGPGVDYAIEQYSCPDRELLAVLQLFRANQQILFRYEIEEGEKVDEIEVTLPSGESKVQEIYNDTVIGFNKLNEEVVRITVEEPIFERPADLHVNSI